MTCRSMLTRVFAAVVANTLSARATRDRRRTRMGEQVNTRRRTVIAGDHDVHLAFKMAKNSVRGALMSNPHGDEVSVIGPEMRESGA